MNNARGYNRGDQGYADSRWRSRSESARPGSDGARPGNTRNIPGTIAGAGISMSVRPSQEYEDAWKQRDYLSDKELRQEMRRREAASRRANKENKEALSNEGEQEETLQKEPQSLPLQKDHYSEKEGSAAPRQSDSTRASYNLQLVPKAAAKASGCNPNANAKEPQSLSQLIQEGSAAPRLSDTERFIAENELEDKAANALRSADESIQRAVIAQGSLRGCFNVTSACLGRIRKVREKNSANGTAASSTMQQAHQGPFNGKSWAQSTNSSFGSSPQHEEKPSVANEDSQQREKNSISKREGNSTSSNANGDSQNAVSTSLQSYGLPDSWPSRTGPKISFETYDSLCEVVCPSGGGGARSVDPDDRARRAELRRKEAEERKRSRSGAGASTLTDSSAANGSDIGNDRTVVSSFAAHPAPATQDDGASGVRDPEALQRFLSKTQAPAAPPASTVRNASAVECKTNDGGEVAASASSVVGAERSSNNIAQNLAGAFEAVSGDRKNVNENLGKELDEPVDTRQPARSIAKQGDGISTTHDKKPAVQYFTATNSFDATQYGPEYLSFNQNDIIGYEGVEEAGWRFGFNLMQAVQNGDQVTKGWFPPAFVKEA